MNAHNAPKSDLFAAEHRRRKIDKPCDPLLEIKARIDFSALSAETDRIAPRPVNPQDARPPYPTEMMARRKVSLIVCEKNGAEKSPRKRQKMENRPCL
jgi:hypothetical protein